MPKAFAGVMAMGLALGLLPLGCGGAAGEEYTMVRHPAGETGAPNAW